MNESDSYDLRRFVDAQAGVYDRALAELRRGRKQSHWMWFVFPQCAGLGRSAMSERYAIRSAAEARAYLTDPLLGQRLLECADALLAVTGRTAREILGSPDDMKLRSSATLFAAVSPSRSVFHRILEHYYGGVEDPITLRFLASSSCPPRT
jgi:uncharacterized protein (DUF1810 family)